MRTTLAVTLLNLRTLPQRWGVALVTAVCLAGVSGVLVSMLAMAQGFRDTFERSGRSDRVVVMSTGEITEVSSAIGRDQAPLILNASGLKRGADGVPVAMLERYTSSDLLRRGRDTEGTLVIRGVGANVLEVRPETRINTGRRFTPGLRELTVGRAAAGQFVGLDLGKEVSLSGVVWTVVGVFDDGGSARESEVWADVEVVMTAYNQTSYTAMSGLLESDSAFTAFKDAVTANPQLQHTPQRETEYYASQGGLQATAMRVVGYVVAGIMALGALFGAINTMYASIESRSVEIATLRALGFRGTPIVISVLLESVVLCGFGALAGGGIAWLLFDGYTASTVGGSGFSQVAFAFNVSAVLLLQGVLWATAIGLLGGLFPALRAARMPIIEGLRAA